MILWITSYPKSGNTWVRALISSYIYSNDASFNFNLLNKIPKFTQNKYFDKVVKLEKLKEDPLKISEYWENSQLRINLDNQLKFFKTHNACVSYKGKWFTTEKNTIGYVYIVRDPRAIACSLASHSKISMDQAVNDLLNENNIGLNGPYKLAELPGSWKINYLSWKKKKKFEGIVVKYEDLIDNPKNEFKKILTFLKKIYKAFGSSGDHFIYDEKKISKSVKSCQFSTLRKMEDIYGFSEATNNKFFRVGAKDSWKKELSNELRTKIETSFRAEMIDLGYL